MVRFPISPLVAVGVVLLISVCRALGAVAPYDARSSSVSKCYAWKMRLTSSAPGSVSQSEEGVETIISSRCKVELPACKVVMEVVCKGVAPRTTEASCVPCARRKCTDVIPVCRYVSKAYRKGDCEDSVSEPCLVSMKACSDIEGLKQRYQDQIEQLCPQSAEGIDVRIRVEPVMP